MLPFVLFLCCLSLPFTLSTEYTYHIDKFAINIINGSGNPFQLSVVYDQQNNPQPVFSINNEYKEGSSSLPFIQIGYASLTQEPISGGNFKHFLNGQTYHYLSSSISIDNIYQNTTNQNVVISGLNYHEPSNTAIPYTFVIRRASLNYPYYDNPSHGIQSNQSLDFNITIDTNEHPDIQINRILLRYDTNLFESFMGFGQQYSFMNFRGKVIPILISEQGVGRGDEPVTAFLNEFGNGAGGDWHTSYGSKPLYITNYNRSFALYNYEIVVFDLTHYEYVQVEVYINDTNAISGRIMHGDTPMELISEMTLITGRQKPLPSWLLQGGILGIEGGQQMVYNTTSELIESTKNDKPALIGLWIQDWVGSYTFQPDGTRLLWNWELNTNQYPNWNDMFSKLSQQFGSEIKPFSYINPYFANVSYLSPDGFKHNYFAEGVENGYFIMNASGLPYLIGSISIHFATVDLTNPSAVQWVKNIIQQNMINDTKVAGFMADFGEYVMFDSVFYDKSVKPSFYHNEFAERWSEVVRDAINEVGGDNVVVPWHRSSALQSPKYARSFWFGDQFVTWDSRDGIQSVLYALFSANIMGHTMIHSDIGGYTMLTIEKEGILLFNYTRSQELLLRWLELSAFSDMIFRSHPGNIPNTSYQIYSNDATMAHFVKFSNVFQQLAQYKLSLMNDAYNVGTPVVRHLWFNYPNDENVRKVVEEVKVIDNDDSAGHMKDDYVVIHHEFMLGDCLLMSPVLYPNVTAKRIYLPQGEWRSFWNASEVYQSEGQFYDNVRCPLGEPPVFVCPSWKSYTTDHNS